MSKYRSHTPQTVRIGSNWSGPTPADIVAASGRESIVIRFRNVGGGRRRELMVQIGPAYSEAIHGSVNFSGRTVDGRFLIKGRLDAMSCQAVIERQPVQWAATRAS